MKIELYEKQQEILNYYGKNIKVVSLPSSGLDLEEVKFCLVPILKEFLDAKGKTND